MIFSIHADTVGALIGDLKGDPGQVSVTLGCAAGDGILFFDLDTAADDLVRDIFRHKSCKCLRFSGSLHDLHGCTAVYDKIAGRSLGLLDRVGAYRKSLIP